MTLFEKSKSVSVLIAAGGLTVGTVYASTMFLSPEASSPLQSDFAAEDGKITAAQIARRMNDRASSVLSKHSRLGAVDAVAQDSEFNELPPETVEGVEGQYVMWHPGSHHTYKLYISDSDRPSDAQSLCAQGFGNISCEVTQFAEGFAVTSVIAALEMPGVAPGTYALASADELATADLQDVRLERNVRVFWDRDVMTSATETVFGPDSLNPDEVFTATDEELLQVALDRELAGVWAEKD